MGSVMTPCVRECPERRTLAAEGLDCGSIMQRVQPAIALEVVDMHPLSIMRGADGCGTVQMHPRALAVEAGDGGNFLQASTEVRMSATILSTRRPPNKGTDPSAAVVLRSDDVVTKFRAVVLVNFAIEHGLELHLPARLFKAVSDILQTIHRCAMRPLKCIVGAKMPSNKLRYAHQSHYCSCHPIGNIWPTMLSAAEPCPQGPNVSYSPNNYIMLLQAL